MVDYATLQNLDIAALVPVQFIYIPLGRLTVIPAGYKTYFTLLSLFLHVNYTVYKEGKGTFVLSIFTNIFSELILLLG